MDLSVRPAQQRRSREAWGRVLDAGVAVLTEAGGDGFTIAAVCERAGVTPPTIYRRTPSKDALFLAVYEHGITQIRETEQVAVAEANLDAAPPADVVREAVGVVAKVFFAHRDFLRSVIIISATNDVVRSHGIQASNALSGLFDRLTDRVTDADQRPVRAAVFQMIFGALVLRTGFGPDFATPSPVDDNTFIADLGQVAHAAWGQSSHR